MLLIPTLDQVKQIAPSSALSLVKTHQKTWQGSNTRPLTNNVSVAPKNVETDMARPSKPQSYSPETVSLSERDLQSYISQKIDLAITERIRSIGMSYANNIKSTQPDSYVSLDYTNIPAEINSSSIPKVDFDKVSLVSDTNTKEYNSSLTELKNQLNELQLQISSIIHILHENTEVMSNKRSIEHKFSELGGYAISSYLGKNFNLNATNVVNPYLEISIAIFMTILVLGLIIENRPRYRQKSSEYLSEEIIENPNDEYDFMGSEEGIPAKMNLARAYFDMGLPEKARKVLTDIASKGDSSQKEEARSMLLDLDK